MARCCHAEVGTGAYWLVATGNSSISYEIVKVFKVRYVWLARRPANLKVDVVDVGGSPARSLQNHHFYL